MSIAENIARLRKDKGWTQEMLAGRVNVHQSMIAQIERGTKVPTMLLGKDIADALGCGLDDLLNDTKSA